MMIGKDTPINPIVALKSIVGLQGPMRSRLEKMGVELIGLTSTRHNCPNVQFFLSAKIALHILKIDGVFGKSECDFESIQWSLCNNEGSLRRRSALAEASVLKNMLAAISNQCRRTKVNWLREGHEIFNSNRHHFRYGCGMRCERGRI